MKEGYAWVCRVIDVTETYLTAEVTEEPGTPGGRVHADFSLDVFDRDMRVGDVFDMTSCLVQTAAEPERIETVVLRERAPWTAEDVGRIRTRAAAMWADLQELVEPYPEPRTSET